MQLFEEKPWFVEQNVKVAVVTFEQSWRAEAYVNETGIDWPLLIDSTHHLYAAYQMERGSRSKVMGIANWLGYLKLIFRGRRVRKPTDDIYQLGGDVLIDEDRIIRLHFVSDRPIDRPSIASIKTSIESCKQDAN